MGTVIDELGTCLKQKSSVHPVPPDITEVVVETVFLKRNSAYSETVKGPCMCLSLKKLNLV